MIILKVKEAGFNPFCKKYIFEKIEGQGGGSN